MDDSIEVIVNVTPPTSPIGNVAADVHHPPQINCGKELIKGVHKMKMKYGMMTGLTYEDAMAEFHRFIEFQFKAYYAAEKKIHGNHPPCSPPKGPKPTTTSH